MPGEEPLYRQHCVQCVALPHYNNHNVLPAKQLSWMWAENDDHPAGCSKMYLFLRLGSVDRNATAERIHVFHSGG